MRPGVSSSSSSKQNSARPESSRFSIAEDLTAKCLRTPTPVNNGSTHGPTDEHARTALIKIDKKGCCYQREVCVCMLDSVTPLPKAVPVDASMYDRRNYKVKCFDIIIETISINLKSFNSAVLESLQKPCDKCVCYICDTKAVDCHMYRLENGGHCLALPTTEFNLWNMVKYSREPVSEYDKLLAPYISASGKTFVQRRLTKMLEDDLAIVLRGLFIRSDSVSVTTELPLQINSDSLRSVCDRLVKAGQHRLVVSSCQGSNITPPAWQNLDDYETILKNDSDYARTDFFKNRFLEFSMSRFSNFRNIYRERYMELIIDIYNLPGDEIDFYIDSIKKAIDTANKFNLTKPSGNFHGEYMALINNCKLLMAIGNRCLDSPNTNELIGWINDVGKAIEPLDLFVAAAEDEEERPNKRKIATNNSDEEEEPMGFIAGGDDDDDS
jgi:hypothetical protein